MSNTVFYSWQSDLPNNTNRGFIEDALKKAIKKINNNIRIEEPERDGDIVLDKDTQDVPGSPPIVDVILGECSEFCVSVN